MVIFKVGEFQVADKLVDKILAIFGGLAALKYGKELLVFIISILPILELRGGLIAARLLNLNPVPAYVISIIGNILPIPFILLFITKIMDWMRKSKVSAFNKFVNWLDGKVEKNKAQIEKYGYLGLILFVGIPLPGTGAWTGCLIASVLELDKKKSFGAAMVGVFLASIIMMIITYLIPALIK